MRICENCGHHDNPLWENSRFEFNAEYMRFSEAEQQPELEVICMALADARNHEPLIDGQILYYKRGTGSIELYRQTVYDFQVSRERKRHKKVES